MMIHFYGQKIKAISNLISLILFSDSFPMFFFFRWIVFNFYCYSAGAQHYDSHMQIHSTYSFLLSSSLLCLYCSIWPQSNDNICFALQIYNHRRYGYVIRKRKSNNNNKLCLIEFSHTFGHPIVAVDDFHCFVVVVVAATFVTVFILFIS